MTSAKEQPPLRKECRETIVFEKSIDQMNSDERRSKLSEIVTNGLMKKAPRNIWGNPEARKEMDWWPDDIPFAAPKSIRGGRYVHNSDTIGHCLESYLDYMENTRSRSLSERDENHANTDAVEHHDHNYSVQPISRERVCMEIEETHEISEKVCSAELESERTTDKAVAIVDLEETGVTGTLSTTGSERVCTRNGITIYKSDIDSLEGCGWLTSNVIDAAVPKKMYSDRRLTTVHDSSWSQVTERGKRGQGRMLDPGLHLFPICLGGHWWLIAGQVKVVRDQVTGELLRQSIVPYHMDSLVKGSQRRHKAAMQRLDRYLGWDCGGVSSWNWLTVTVPQQNNTYDCGVHTIHNAWRLAEIGVRALSEMKTHGKIHTTRTMIKNYILQG